jgi:PAS domain S-box-containing protein
MAETKERGKHMTLKLKLLLSISVILFVAIGINIVILVQDLQRDYREAIEWRSASLAQSLSADISGRYSSYGKLGDLPLILEASFMQCKTLFEANQDLQVSYVSVVNDAGVILAHNDRSMLKRNLQDPGLLDALRKRELNTVADQTDYHTFIPIVTRDGIYLATVDIGFPKTVVDEKVWRLFYKAVGLFVLIFSAIFLTVWFFVNRFVAIPVTQFVEATAAIADGNLTQQIEITSTGEFRRLSIALTQMRDSIKENITALSKKCRELEEEARERKQAEVELIESKKLIAEVVENVSLMIFLKEATDLRFVIFNRAGEELVGYDRGDLIGKNDLDLFPREQAAYFMAKDREVLDGEAGMLDIPEEPILTAGKGERFLHTRKVSIRGADGATKFLLGISEDITERKQAEEKLRQSRDLLSNLACLVPGVIYQYRLNPDGSSAFPWSSPGMNDIYEVTPEEVKEDATPVFGRLHPEDLEMVSNAIQESARTLDTFFCEYRVILPRQGLRWRWSQAQPERTEDGGTLWHGIISDITERKEMEGLLQKTQRMEAIGSFAGGIAHDFNNLLFPIVGMSEMLLEDLYPGSPEHESVQQIFKAGMRGSDLVKQILAFSRQTEHKMIPVRVQQVLKEVIKLTRSAIPSDIKVSQYIQSDCGLVIADPTQLHQIAMNLITNAFHAVEETGGKISVSLKETVLEREELPDSSLEPGNYAMMTVADTGCGIDPGDMDKIFEPYFTTKEQGKGTGLGLAVVSGIIKEHGGDIRVYSEVGKGSTFDVYLPLAVQQVEQASGKPVDIHQTGTERILLVDDEEPIVHLEKQLLERLGYKVTMRVNSLEALEAFKANPDAYDLILTDMTMPNMTGDQLARKLIAIRPDIPIIICTGFSERINKDMAKAMGIKGFLMKPVVKSEMARMVRKVLDETKGVDQP